MRGLLILVACGALGGCANGFVVEAQNDCTRFGFAAGTPEYAQCVSQQFEARRLQFMQAGLVMQQMGANLQAQQPAPISTMAPAGSHLGMQQVQGLNRICSYPGRGTVIIPSARLCPATIP